MASSSTSRRRSGCWRAPDPREDRGRRSCVSIVSPPSHRAVGVRTVAAATASPARSATTATKLPRRTKSTWSTARGADRNELGAEPRRADHAGVPHPGEYEVVHEHGLAAKLRRQVDAAEAVAGVPARLDRNRVGDLVDLDAEAARPVPGDQLPVGHGSDPAIGDDPVVDAQPVRRATEMVGGAGHEDPSSVGARLAHRHAALLDRPAAPGVALVRRFTGGGAFTRRREGSTLNSSAAMAVSDVRSPCPSSALPERMRIVPSGSKRIQRSSCGLPASPPSRC